MTTSRTPTPPGTASARRDPRCDPARLLLQVVAASYVQIWWPPCDQPVYTDRLPVWQDGDYVDPDTGELLPTWDGALDQLAADPDARPAHVARFGRQTDMKGIIAPVLANPTRELERLSKPRRVPRALSEKERARWFAALAGDEIAMRQDLFDLSAFLLATGLRIGEALALLWREVDLGTGELR